MIDQSQIERVRGADAYSSDGEHIGTVVHLFSRDNVCEPAWATVLTGLFGASASFAPLSNATLSQGRLNLAYDMDMVIGAPRVASVVPLSVERERELYAYYGLEYAGGGDQRESSLHRHLVVEHDGQVVCSAEVTIFGHGVTSAMVSLHSESGQIPPGSRGRLVDKVLALPELQRGARLEASVPRGDEEFLVRLQERCDRLATRIAGVTVLVTAELTAGPFGAQSLATTTGH